MLDFTPDHVPGLWQTEDHVRALIGAAIGRGGASAVADAVAVQMIRQRRPAPGRSNR